MATNTSSRGHPLQHQILVSPIVENTDQSSTPDSTTKSKTWETTITHVPSWPEEARTLKKHTWLSYFYSLGDIILVLLPIYFVRKWNGIDLSVWGSDREQFLVLLSLRSMARQRKALALGQRWKRPWILYASSKMTASISTDPGRVLPYSLSYLQPSVGVV